jgi:hypothetical protein
LAFKISIPFRNPQGIHLGEMKAYVLTKIYMQIFIAALFVITENYKQPKIPSVLQTVADSYNKILLFSNQKQ